MQRANNSNRQTAGQKLMHRLQITILVSVCMSLSVSPVFGQVNQDKELIKKVIQNAYVDGLCNNADEDAIRKGFHPGFTMFYVGDNNTMWEMPIHNWIEMAKTGKEKGYTYSFQNEFTTIKFLSIDVTGTVAVAKIEFYEGRELKFIDYLSLMKFEDGWKIVTKMFHAIPKEEKEDDNKAGSEK